MAYKWRHKFDLDAAVLAYLSGPSKCNGGAARWVIADGINETEGSVNASLRRLKAAGRVVFGPKRMWRVT